MAAVMKEAVRMDEDSSNQQQEMMARLLTENKVSKMLKIWYIYLCIFTFLQLSGGRSI